MSWLAIVLLSLTALVLLLAGIQKVALQPKATTPMRRLGVADKLTRVIGFLELAGVTGLVIGVWVRPLGVAAGIGLAALLLGAIAYHVRAGDYRSRQNRGSAAAPVVLLLLLAGLAGSLLVV